MERVWVRREEPPVDRLCHNAKMDQDWPNDLRFSPKIKGEIGRIVIATQPENYGLRAYPNNHSGFARLQWPITASVCIDDIKGF